MASGIKLQLNGFDELLKEIESAGRSIDSAVDSCMRQSAKTVEAALKSEMSKANVPQDLIARMPNTITTKSANYISVKVGYDKGEYDPSNPSDGYKVVFLNYGTPNRSKHGKIEEGGKITLGFIQRAKKNSSKTIKKQQEETLKKILARLQK